MELLHTGNAALTHIRTKKHMKQTKQMGQMGQAGAARMRTSWFGLQIAALSLFVISLATPFAAQEARPAGVAPAPAASFRLRAATRRVARPATIALTRANALARCA